MRGVAGDDPGARVSEDALRARDLVASSERVSARDALHLAVMARYGVRRILTFDAGFDAVAGIERIAE